jgi:hypothetical protein
MKNSSVLLATENLSQIVSDIICSLPMWQRTDDVCVRLVRQDKPGASC